MIAAAAIALSARGESEHPLNPLFNIYVLRHAETVANATTNYTAETESQFTDHGWSQTTSVVERLKPLGITRVVVSPTWRTQHTVLPFLIADDLTGEIWPELEECCCGLSRRADFSANIPSGPDVKLEDPARFSIRPDGATRLRPTNDEEAYTKIARAADRLIAEFGQTTNTVLVVSHGCMGSRLMEYLTDHTPRGRYNLWNTGISHVIVDGDHRMKVVMVNDEPVESEGGK